jgi:SAM-dependent methyltransferase
MQLKLLKVLACPECLGDLSCEPTELGPDDEIEAGTLTCCSCRKQFPILAGIPRFVESDNYASSFGYQWNLFKAEQIDSINGSSLSGTRFYSETKWTSDWMRSKWILDAGCGAGRFLDVASKNDCEVIGLDISNATDAAHSTLGERKNLHLVQASIYELPFRSEAFDGCYCIGVIQHTPDPPRALQSLPRVLKPRGRLAVTIYERKRWTPLNAKYLIRPATRRLSQKRLLDLIRVLMPLLFPLTEVFFRIPLLAGVFSFIIPVANYVHESSLSLRQRYRWAVLDTFDMLSPHYDQPQTEAECRRALEAGGLNRIERLNNPGVNLVGLKCISKKTGVIFPPDGSASNEGPDRNGI